MGFMLVALPPLGVLWRGGALTRYFEFPPRSRFIDHAAFSWTAFAFISGLVLVSTAPLWISLLRPPTTPVRPATRQAFPWWGWAGAVLGGIAWILAWSRLPWFGVLQPHTFPMLWGPFILVVNGLTRRRTGRCLMTARPVAFGALFPVSAVFWWFFEYLNRFVQNWHYAGADYPPLTYFILATLSFATVLPAVLSVREWLLSFPRVANTLQGRRLPLAVLARPAVGMALTSAGFGLVLAGGAPDFGFPFLWLSPLVIVLAFQVLDGRCPLLEDACRGIWDRVAAAALAGLFCGLFWEMWNYYSLARWSYTVPWVDRLHLFEMPLLGYAGYLPFGLVCAIIGDAILSPGPPKKTGVR